MDAEPVVTSIILSDGVIVEHGTGKLSRIGCFNSLTLPKIPCPLPGFFVTIGIANVLTGETALKVTVRIEDPKSGHVISSAGAEMKLGLQMHVQGGQPGQIPPQPPTPPPELRSVIIDVPIRVQNVVFQKPGLYDVVVLVDNEAVHKRSLFVQVMPQKPNPKPEP